MFELSSWVINSREKTPDFEDPQLNGAVLSAQIFMRLRLDPVGQGASKKKEKENKGQKNNPKKQPTDFPFFFFF